MTQMAYALDVGASETDDLVRSLHPDGIDKCRLSTSDKELSEEINRFLSTPMEKLEESQLQLWLDATSTKVGRGPCVLN